MAEEFLFQEEDDREAWIRFLVAEGIVWGMIELSIEDRLGLYLGGREGEARGVVGKAGPETGLF